MSSPIADLSYRHYDGELLPPVNRWWAIAKASIRLSTKKKGFWIWSALSGYWYLFMIATYYFIDNFYSAASANGAVQLGQKNPILSTIIWKDQFLNGFSISQMLLFIVALMIGAGTISNDNRANALLVYLSKPCTKADYVIGKWFGIFLPLSAVTLAPTLFFYAYCAMSFKNYDFFSQDPWLLPQLVLISLIPGAVHASLALGISSLFNQGRLAGATYAGLYFMSLFFTKAMQVVHIQTTMNDHVVSPLVDKLYYLSVDGIQIGLAKLILSTGGSNLFPTQGSLTGMGNRNLSVPAPSFGFIVPLAVIACGIGLLVAWRRVRAVEVVGR